MTHNVGDTVSVETKADASRLGVVVKIDTSVNPATKIAKIERYQVRLDGNQKARWYDKRAVSAS